MHLKISSTGMMVTGETITDRMTITKKKERVMVKKRNTTVMNIADLMTRLIKGCKVVLSEGQILDNHNIRIGEDEHLKYNSNQIRSLNDHILMCIFKRK